MVSASPFALPLSAALAKKRLHPYRQRQHVLREIFGDRDAVDRVIENGVQALRYGRVHPA